MDVPEEPDVDALSGVLFAGAALLSPPPFSDSIAFLRDCEG